MEIARANLIRWRFVAANTYRPFTLHIPQSMVVPYKDDIFPQAFIVFSHRHEERSLTAAQ